MCHLDIVKIIITIRKGFHQVIHMKKILLQIKRFLKISSHVCEIPNNARKSNIYLTGLTVQHISLGFLTGATVILSRSVLLYNENS